MPVKKKVTNSSLRAKRPLRLDRIEARSNPKKEIASSPKAPRNDARGSKLSAPVYSFAGRASGNIALPKEIFGQEVNEKLLAQAIRVYQTAKKTLPGNTKTRGEVRGSTAKIYRQKGTGRARHGSIRAPIFVGGGIVFGPKPRKVTLNLPKKMRNRALIHALSQKAKDKEILGISGIEKASGKTKEIAYLTGKLKIKSALFVTGEKMDNVVRGVRNMPTIVVLPTNQLNAYEVLKYKSLLITKDAIDKLTGKGVKK